jgi:hypothetical protein
VKGAKRKSFLTAFIHVGNIPATKYPILKKKGNDERGFSEYADRKAPEGYNIPGGDIF